MVLIWVANLPKVRFCYRVVVGIPGRTSVPILNLSTPPGGGGKEATYMYVGDIIGLFVSVSWGTAPPTQKLACFVLYLKIINTLKTDTCILQ